MERELEGALPGELINCVYRNTDKGTEPPNGARTIITSPKKV